MIKEKRFFSFDKGPNFGLESVTMIKTMGDSKIVSSQHFVKP